MATLAPINLGTAADDGTGDNIRAGGQKINDNDAALNTELVALLTSMGIASGDVNLGVFTGNTITDNVGVKPALQDLESSLETINALSAGYAPLNTTVPTPADTIETAIAKLDGEVRSLNEADRLAGTFDATVGTFPTVANGGAVNGNTVEAGYWFEVTNAGTLDGVNFQVGDFLRALVDRPSTTTIAGNWVHELNRPNPAYSSTVANQNVDFDGLYVHGDHNINLPKITTENDGQAISIAPLDPWGSATMTNNAWTEAPGDNLEAITLPGGSNDIVSLIPVFGTLTWLVRVGGAPVPELAASYDTFAQMVAVSPTTLSAGTQVSVTNDPTSNLNGTYTVTGPAGGAGTGYIK